MRPAAVEDSRQSRVKERPIKAGTRERPCVACSRVYCATGSKAQTHVRCEGGGQLRGEGPQNSRHVWGAAKVAERCVGTTAKRPAKNADWSGCNTVMVGERSTIVKRGAKA